MERYITLQDRKFKVIRSCRESLTTQETREFIKLCNPLIDIVLSDGHGNLLFCHEAKDAQVRDATNEEPPVTDSSEDE